MAIPDEIIHKLSEDMFQRDYAEKILVNKNLQKLGISQSSDFANFYQRFKGVHGSEAIGHELLDLQDQNYISIMSSTKDVRDTHGWAKNFIVISDFVGGGLLVYDSKTEKIYHIDFEGSDTLLFQGKLEPSWENWENFLLEFFGSAESYESYLQRLLRARGYEYRSHSFYYQSTEDGILIVRVLGNKQDPARHF